MVRGYKTKLRMREDGTWIDYHRATLEDVEDWVGWNVVLLLLLEALRTNYYRKPAPNMPYSSRVAMRRSLQFRDISLEAVSMLLGGRISETLMLHAGNFSNRKDRIVVKDMPLLKRYKVYRERLRETKEHPKNLEADQRYHWDKSAEMFVTERVYTEPRIVKRKDFPIPLWEKPLVDILQLRLDWANRQEGEYKWLFPTRHVPTRKESVGIQKWIEEEFGLEKRAWLSNQRAYQIVRRLGQRVGLEETAHIWNHWWRIIRASQLGAEYEMETAHLNAFFGWTGGLTRRRSMATRYSRVGSRRVWKRMLEAKGEVRAELAEACEAVKWAKGTKKFFKYWEKRLEAV